MTLEDWVIACRAEGYLPVLVAMRPSPAGPEHVGVTVGSEPQWLTGKYAGEAGDARFRQMLRTTWQAELESYGVQG